MKNFIFCKCTSRKRLVHVNFPYDLQVLLRISCASSCGLSVIQLTWPSFHPGPFLPWHVPRDIVLVLRTCYLISWAEFHCTTTSLFTCCCVHADERLSQFHYPFASASKPYILHPTSLHTAYITRHTPTCQAKLRTLAHLQLLTQLQSDLLQHTSTHTATIHTHAVVQIQI